jgi:biotin operon repressor
MSIIRSPRLESNFSVISNSVIRDSRLSYRARGVLLEILSRPDNWRVSGDSLSRGGKEGRDAILTALKELRDCGYIRTVKQRKESGTFETINYVYDTPQQASVTVLPTPENPTLVEPHPEKPTPGKPQLVNQGSLEELSKKNLDTNNEFEIFWNVYPRKVAKKAAEAAFTKAVKHTPFALILSGAGRYAKDPNRLDAFTAHPATWLNAHRWLDDALPERIKTPEEKKADELRLSREKELREQEASRNYFAEQEAARARAVPMPEELRSILRNM